MARWKAGRWCVAAGAALSVACTDGTGPVLERIFAGEVTNPQATTVEIAATAHARDDCTAGGIVGRAATRTDAQGRYAFRMTLPRSEPVCVRVTATPTGLANGAPDTVTVHVRDPISEGKGDTIRVPTAQIRIVITRPNP